MSRAGVGVGVENPNVTPTPSLVTNHIPSAQTQAFARPLLVFKSHFLIHSLVYDHLLAVPAAQTPTFIRRLPSHNFHLVGLPYRSKAIVRPSA
jgi:hypothetical protein